MNRRSFLTRLGIGIVATAALAQVPASVIKRSEWLAQAGKHWATERLYKAWHLFYRTRGQVPQIIKVDAYTFEIYEGELQINQRFVPVWALREGRQHVLMFKGAWVMEHNKPTIEVL